MQPTPSTPGFLSGLVASEPKRPPTEDQLKQITEAARRLQAQEQLIGDLEEHLKQEQALRNELRHKTLPDMMDAAGITHLGIAPHGNAPAFDINLKPYYSANIAAKWPPAQREAAFFALEEANAGSLIKTVVKVSLPREERDRLKPLLATLKAGSYQYTVEESVHPQTLTAWVKEQAQAGAPLPPLEAIGATIGRVATIKDRSDD